MQAAPEACGALSAVSPSTDAAATPAAESATAVEGAAGHATAPPPAAVGVAGGGGVGGGLEKLLSGGRSFARVFLPDVALSAGQELIGAIQGHDGANLAHLQRRYARGGVALKVCGEARADWQSVSAERRLHVSVLSRDRALLDRVTDEVRDLVETAVDLVADNLGLDEEQVQQAFEAIRVKKYGLRVEKCDEETVAAGVPKAPQAYAKEAAAAAAAAAAAVAAKRGAAKAAAQAQQEEDEDDYDEEEESEEEESEESEEEEISSDSEVEVIEPVEKEKVIIELPDDDEEDERAQSLKEILAQLSGLTPAAAVAELKGRGFSPKEVVNILKVGGSLARGDGGTPTASKNKRAAQSTTTATASALMPPPPVPAARVAARTLMPPPPVPKVISLASAKAASPAPAAAAKEPDDPAMTTDAATKTGAAKVVTSMLDDDEAEEDVAEEEPKKQGELDGQPTEGENETTQKRCGDGELATAPATQSEKRSTRSATPVFTPPGDSFQLTPEAIVAELRAKGFSPKDVLECLRSQGLLGSVEPSASAAEQPTPVAEPTTPEPAPTTTPPPRPSSIRLLRWPVPVLEDGMAGEGPPMPPPEHDSWDQDVQPADPGKPTPKEKAKQKPGLPLPRFSWQQKEATAEKEPPPVEEAPVAKRPKPPAWPPPLPPSASPPQKTLPKMLPWKGPPAWNLRPLNEKAGGVRAPVVVRPLRSLQETGARPPGMVAGKGFLRPHGPTATAAQGPASGTAAGHGQQEDDRSMPHVFGSAPHPPAAVAGPTTGEDKWGSILTMLRSNQGQAEAFGQYVAGARDAQEQAAQIMQKQLATNVDGGVGSPHPTVAAIDGMGIPSVTGTAAATAGLRGDNPAIVNGQQSEKQPPQPSQDQQLQQGKEQDPHDQVEIKQEIKKEKQPAPRELSPEEQQQQQQWRVELERRREQVDAQLQEMRSQLVNFTKQSTEEHQQLLTLQQLLMQPLLVLPVHRQQYQQRIQLLQERQALYAGHVQQITLRHEALQQARRQILEEQLVLPPPPPPSAPPPPPPQEEKEKDQEEAAAAAEQEQSNLLAPFEIEAPSQTQPEPEPQEDQEQEQVPSASQQEQPLDTGSAPDGSQMLVQVGEGLTLPVELAALAHVAAESEERMRAEAAAAVAAMAAVAASVNTSSASVATRCGRCGRVNLKAASDPTEICVCKTQVSDTPPLPVEPPEPPVPPPPPPEDFQPPPPGPEPYTKTLSQVEQHQRDSRMTIQLKTAAQRSEALRQAAGGGVKEEFANPTFNVRAVPPPETFRRGVSRSRSPCTPAPWRRRRRSSSSSSSEEASEGTRTRAAIAAVIAARRRITTPARVKREEKPERRVKREGSSSPSGEARKNRKKKKKKKDKKSKKAKRRHDAADSGVTSETRRRPRRDDSEVVKREDSPGKSPERRRARNDAAASGSDSGRRSSKNSEADKVAASKKRDRTASDTDGRRQEDFRRSMASPSVTKEELTEDGGEVKQRCLVERGLSEVKEEAEDDDAGNRSGKRRKVNEPKSVRDSDSKATKPGQPRNMLSFQSAVKNEDETHEELARVRRQHDGDVKPDAARGIARSGREN
eukprot:TRINITY_DN10729_c0_g1_i1.p1 TRINITY_DN10729_c0_g1~~TRINITY_DN10729_c0_g1_i1.p1  ORF type:complete len:1597 (-),score=480.08 TRINITY_DN10729_c0_g1_i1:99-4829(-)